MGFCEHGNEPSSSVKCGKILYCLKKHLVLKDVYSYSTQLRYKTCASIICQETMLTMVSPV
jgi:hypothetical protein